MADNLTAFSQIQYPNPLQGASQAVGLANQFQSNQLMQLSNQQKQVELQQQQAALGVGKIIANRIQPDNTVDWAGAEQDMKASGNPAYESFSKLRDSDLAANQVTVPNASGGYSTTVVPKQEVNRQMMGGDTSPNTAINASGAGNIATPQPVGAVASQGTNQATGLTTKQQIQDAGQKGIALADNAKLALSTLDSGVKTGKYAPAVANLKSMVSYVGGNSSIAEAATNDTSKIQILAKELARVQGAVGSNDKTDMDRALTALQSGDITKVTPALRTILLYNQAQGEQSKGVFNGMQKTLGANPQGIDVNNYSNNVQQNTDPAIFRYALMSPAEQKEFRQQRFSGANGQSARDSFVQKYDTLKSLGVLDSVGQ